MLQACRGRYIEKRNAHGEFSLTFGHNRLNRHLWIKHWSQSQIICRLYMSLPWNRDGEGYTTASISPVLWTVSWVLHKRQKLHSTAPTTLIIFLPCLLCRLCLIVLSDLVCFSIFSSFFFTPSCVSPSVLSWSSPFSFFQALKGEDWGLGCSCACPLGSAYQKISI